MFTGTAAEGAAVTDLSGVDFEADTQWQAHFTDLGTVDYADTARWELATALGVATYTTASGSQTLGTATVPYDDPVGVYKACLRLGGTTTGNSVSNVTFEGGDIPYKNRFFRISA